MVRFIKLGGVTISKGFSCSRCAPTCVIMSLYFSFGLSSRGLAIGLVATRCNYKYHSLMENWDLWQKRIVAYSLLEKTNRNKQGKRMARASG